MQAATTITVAHEGELHIFRVIPLTSIGEFVENAGMLVKPTDVALGAEMGWWTVL